MKEINLKIEGMHCAGCSTRLEKGGLIVFAIINLFIINSNPSKSQDLTLENIDAVKASAAEGGCDASNTNPCKVTITGVGIIEGTGKSSLQN